ncbi:LysE family translocator [Yoonia sp.]|uniref:LysE family translocator n=1 Tax=Yoonia sp. TaxID=2212373 RepID=UPI0025DE1D08|nr:LysE family translocator [Yoonia sp.]
MAELLPLIGFVFLGLFSPGPNVILLTASGARFGFKRTIPHILGVAIGVGITAGITGLGIGALLAVVPMLTALLKIVASLWILWMAVILWRADPAKTNSRARPFSFIEAILFQWINPKVWAVAMSATAYVATLPAMDQAMTLGVMFSTLNLGVCLFWTMAGALLSYLLTNPVAWQIFLRIMAIGLVGFSALIFI